MNNEDKLALGIDVATWLEAQIGKIIEIKESITDRDFDRHGTSNVFFEMQLENLATRFSGARTMLSGTNGELYEFPIDNIIGQIDSNKITLIEELGSSKIETILLRKTIITIKERD